MAQADRIFESEQPSVGVVIGTYGSPCYVHLGLEMLRRTAGDIPVLVHDDASFQTVPAEHEQLRRICESYGADFSTNESSYGHMQGDFTVFIAGWRWAESRRLDMLVKFSRRFIPIREWVRELCTLAYVTQYATYSNGDACHGLGFRSESVAMHVPSWLASGVLGSADEMMRHNVNWFVELIVHNMAREVHRRNCAFNRAYEMVHPPVEANLSYGMWPFMGGSRCVRMPGYMWRDCWSVAEYHQKAVEVGISDYVYDNFINFKEH